MTFRKNVQAAQDETYRLNQAMKQAQADYAAAREERTRIHNELYRIMHEGGKASNRSREEVQQERDAIEAKCDELENTTARTVEAWTFASHDLNEAQRALSLEQRRLIQEYGTRLPGRYYREISQELTKEQRRIELEHFPAPG